MLETNSGYLYPELMDVVRAMDAEDEDIKHYFSYGGGEFYNCVEMCGEFYDFTEKYEPEDDEDYRRYAKRFSKLALYKVLSDVKGVTLPWGALTGIRPTKIAYRERDAGRDFGPLFARLGVSGEKTSLTARVMASQEDIYKRNFRSGSDIFISIPFCPTKCVYCSFITAPISKTSHLVDGYVSALKKEIESLSGYVTKVNSVYIGGGTPFTLGEEDLETILSAASVYAGGGTEFTVEAGRPDTFTEEKLDICRGYGVNRICVNPQTFKDETLSLIGRAHTVEDMYRAYDMAAGKGFSVNIDLIAGFRNETAEDFLSGVRRAAELSPDNITVHTLCLKAGSALKETAGRLSPDGIEEMLSGAEDILTASGYEPYYLYRQKYQAGGGENTGWAKKGRQCVYNIDTMEEICDNVAVGSNAISKRVFASGGRIERFPTPKDIPTYLAKAPSLTERRKEFFTSAE